MARQPKSQPLKPSELEYFDEVLAGFKGPIRSFEALDGLFCALICAPRLVAPSEYIGLIMGAGGAFESNAKAHQITDLMVRHFNTVVTQLQRTLRTDDIYVPALIVDDQGVAAGNEWAAGFMAGVDLSGQGWAAIKEDKKRSPMIAPMTALATEHAPQHDADLAKRAAVLAPENREDLLEDMFVGLADLFAHFESQRRESTAPLSAQPITRTGTGPKPKHNNPCACGSGKKYKQCCGAVSEPVAEQ